MPVLGLFNVLTSQLYLGTAEITQGAHSPLSLAFIIHLYLWFFLNIFKTKTKSKNNCCNCYNILAMEYFKIAKKNKAKKGNGSQCARAIILIFSKVNTADREWFSINDSMGICNEVSVTRIDVGVVEIWSWSKLLELFNEETFENSGL